MLAHAHDLVDLAGPSKSRRDGVVIEQEVKSQLLGVKGGPRPGNAPCRTVQVYYGIPGPPVQSRARPSTVRSHSGVAVVAPAIGSTGAGARS